MYKFGAAAKHLQVTTVVHVNNFKIKSVFVTASKTPLSWCNVSQGLF